MALEVCLRNPSLRGEGAAGKCEATGSKEPETYSLEYVGDFFEPARGMTNNSRAMVETPAD